jgi:hypothetical protein
MFRIRKEQKRAFRQAALQQFEDAAARHVERCFPNEWATFGDLAIRQWIRIGIDGAARYGIVAERDVCKFVDLMVVFGVDFDRQCEWARKILDAPTPGDPFARMRILHYRALKAL